MDTILIALAIILFIYAILQGDHASDLQRQNEYLRQENESLRSRATFPVSNDGGGWNIAEMVVLIGLVVSLLYKFFLLPG